MELSKRYPVKIRGCYLLWKNDSVVYVGQSEHIIRRITQHKKDFDEYSYVELKEGDLNELEADLIVTYNPPLNCVFPNSRKYKYIPIHWDTIPSWVDYSIKSNAIPVLDHPKIGKVYKTVDIIKKKKSEGRFWWHDEAGLAICGKCGYGEKFAWIPLSKDGHCPECRFQGKLLVWNKTASENLYE